MQPRVNNEVRPFRVYRREQPAQIQTCQAHLNNQDFTGLTKQDQAWTSPVMPEQDFPAHPNNTKPFQAPPMGVKVSLLPKYPKHSLNGV